MDICPKCGNKNIVMVEYPMDHKDYYDGVSEYWCRKCDYSQGRWSGKELKEGESEPKYGG